MWLGLNRRIFSSLQALGVLLGVLTRLFPLILISKALLDAKMDENTGEPQVKKIEKTNWIILRKKMTWMEAASYCNEKYFRLGVLDSRAKAEELADNLAKMSTPYTPDYDKISGTIEFGMDRRYWIGLSDQNREGVWIWIQDGTPMEYKFWYPGQPDHNKTNKANRLEHCVALWNPGYHEGDKRHSFNDEECLNEHYAICDERE